jgi:hypothetical protein
MDTQMLVLVLGPLILVQVAFALFALRDLLRPERRVKGGNKLVWGLVIVFGELLGPLAYFAFGRHEQER